MIAVTFNSATAYLLDDQPNWAAGFGVEASLPVTYERGLSGRETRRPQGDTLRLAVKFSANLSGSVALTNFRNSLQALNVQTVLCPFWPGEFAAGSMPTVTAPWYVLFTAAGAFQSIQPSSALGSGFAYAACPLMVGILPEIPEASLVNDNYGVVDYRFAENDVYPLTFPAFTAPAGLAAAAGSLPLFPFRPNWSNPPMTAGSEVDIDLSLIHI